MLSDADGKKSPESIDKIFSTLSRVPQFMAGRRLGFKLGFVGLCTVIRSLWLHFETDVKVTFYAKHFHRRNLSLNVAF